MSKQGIWRLLPRVRTSIPLASISIRDIIINVAWTWSLTETPGFFVHFKAGLPNVILSGMWPRVTDLMLGISCSIQSGLTVMVGLRGDDVRLIMQPLVASHIFAFHRDMLVDDGRIVIGIGVGSFESCVPTGNVGIGYN